MRERIIEVNPFQYVDMISRRKTLRSFLSIEELQQLARTECKSPEVKRAFLFVSFSGLRLSDIKSLVWRDVKKEHIEFIQVKTDSPVYLPLNPTLNIILGERQGKDQKVFPLLGDENTRRMIKSWVKKAGIEKDISFHSSRHTFAIIALAADINIKVISEILGHSSVRITEIYSKVLGEAKKAAMNRIPTIEF